MWCLETLKQLNEKRIELSEKKVSDSREIYTECGIKTLGNTPKPVNQAANLDLVKK